jgi:hypothetical protein
MPAFLSFSTLSAEASAPSEPTRRGNDLSCCRPRLPPGSRYRTVHPCRHRTITGKVPVPDIPLAPLKNARHPSPDPSPDPCSKPCTATSRPSKTFITNPSFPANVDPAAPAAPQAIESARPSSLDALTPSALVGT